MSNPNPTTPTPLPSQWDSGIIKNLLYAALTLIATVAADYFGVAEELIKEKGGRLIEALITLLAVGVPLGIAYWNRMYKPTPPITQQAVEATAQRELKIASATPAMKETAAKSHWVVGILAVLLTIGSLFGCAANPHKTAQTVEQQGDATYGELVILKEQGSLILNEPGVSDDVKRVIAEAIVEAKPITDSGQDTLMLYSKIRAEMGTSADAKQRLFTVDRDIAEWIAQAKPIIAKLSNAIAGARK